MAVQLLYTPNYAIDDGVFAPGARASFFLSDTTTPIVVYADEGLTVPHTVPLVADASGRFATVWSEDATNVKVVVTDAAGGTIYTQNKVVLGNIAVGSAASVSFVPQANNPATNVQAAIEFNADAIDAIEASTPSQSQAVWNSGVATVESLITPAKLDTKIKNEAGGVLLGPFSTASGASVTGTGIPSWATQVDVLFSGVVRATGGDVFVRLGTASGVESTGYDSGSTYQDTSTTLFRSTAVGMQITQNAVFPLSGIVSLIKGPSNTWNCSISLAAVGTSRTVIGAGVKPLSGTLDRVQLVADVSVFNGGSFYVRCR
jgi:hypothetical protein